MVVVGTKGHIVATARASCDFVRTLIEDCRCGFAGSDAGYESEDSSDKDVNHGGCGSEKEVSGLPTAHRLVLFIFPSSVQTFTSSTSAAADFGVLLSTEVWG